MSGICSAHRHREPDCDLCNTDIRELIPDYDQMCAEAEKRGKIWCPECQFVSYARDSDTQICPLCNYQW
jgi:formamidopyrimidine-DNA glycosylase